MEARRIALTDGVVVLDRFTADDMDAHLAGEDEEQAKRFGWWPKRSGPEQFRRMLADDEESWRTRGPRRKLAMRVAGELAGGIEVHVARDGLAHMSYWTFPQFRQRGFATRAARLAAGWAFSALDIQRIELEVEEDNLASRDVARGAGFVETGRKNEDGLLVYERRR